MYNLGDVFLMLELIFTLLYNAGEQLASGADGMISITAAFFFLSTLSTANSIIALARQPRKFSLNQLFLFLRR